MTTTTDGKGTGDQHRKFMEGMRRRLEAANAELAVLRKEAEIRRLVQERDDAAGRESEKRTREKDRLAVERMVEKFEKKRTLDTAKREAAEEKKWSMEKAREEAKRMRKEAADAKHALETPKERESRLRKNEKARERRAAKKAELRIANEVLTPVLSKKALKCMAMKYVITPVQTYEPVSFLRKAEDAIIELLNGLRGTQARNVMIRLVCEMVRTNPETGAEEITDAGFATGNWKLYGEDDAGNVWGSMREKMLESFSEYQKRGSGWRVSRVVMLEIHIGKFIPLSGSGKCTLPKKIADKKAIINMENSDNQCFRWAVTRALNPTVDNPGRITKRLREQSAELDWTDVEFPTPIDSKSIGTFEDNNGVTSTCSAQTTYTRSFPCA